MNWNEIDSHLASLGKDRLWLSTESGYSEASVREALAPNSKKRSTRMLAILSRVIEEAEGAQHPLVSDPVPGIFDLFLTPEALDKADRASRIVGAESLAAFCRDVIDAEADRILAAERTGAADAPGPVEPPAPSPPTAGPASRGSSSPGGSQSEVA